MHNKFESQNMYITFCKYFHRILRGYKLCCFMSSPVYSSYFRMHHITISSTSTINQHEKDCYLWYVINETKKKNIKLKMIYQSQWRILNQITPTSFSWHNFKNFSSVSESHSELENAMTWPSPKYITIPSHAEM